MKALFFLLLPVIVFSQEASYPDTIETLSGDIYPCSVLKMDEESITVVYGKNNKQKIGLSGLLRIVIKEKGEILTQRDGLIFNIVFINRILMKRESAYVEEDAQAQLGHLYRPGDHELLLMPTALTMNKGSAYISSYELLFLNFSAAVTSRTHLSIFTLFPMTSEFVETISIGIKQNYLRNEKIEGAFWAQG